MNWISIKDRLPTRDATYPTYCGRDAANRPIYFVATWDEVNQAWRCDDGDLIFTVTHWVDFEIVPPEEPTASLDPLQEIANLIAEADRIHRSTADRETKYRLIFAIDIRSKIKAVGLEFDYYDPDTTYEADVTAYVEALKEFRGRWGNLIPEASS